MRYLITAIAALAIAALGTIPKLYKMYQITGAISGATRETSVITAKWEEWEPQGRSILHFHMISWGDAAHRKDNSHSTRVDPGLWRSFSVGQSIELVRIPGDEHRYLADQDIFVSGGNFEFDYVLLAVELVVGVGALVKFVAHLVARSRTTDAVS